MTSPSHRRETQQPLPRPLTEQFFTPDAVSAEVARHARARTLPKDTIQIIRDIHGEHAKLRDGIDIVPEIMEVTRWDNPRTIDDTERGAWIRARMNLLQRLVRAYRDNWLRQRHP